MVVTKEELQAQEPKSIREANSRFNQLCGLYNSEKNHNARLENELEEVKRKYNGLADDFKKLVEEERARVTAELIATYSTKLPSTTPDATNTEIVAEKARIAGLPNQADVNTAEINRLKAIVTPTP